MKVLLRFSSFFVIALCVLVLNSCSSSKQASCPSFNKTSSKLVGTTKKVKKKKKSLKNNDDAKAYAANKKTEKPQQLAQSEPYLIADADGEVISNPLTFQEISPVVKEKLNSKIEEFVNQPVIQQKLADKKIKSRKPISQKKLAKVNRNIEKISKRIDKQISKAEKKNGNATQGEKSQLVALILVLVVGALGIHRFYLGYTTIGIIQLLTLGGCGVWALIDLIRIITGDLEPKNGPYDETL